MKAQYAKSVDPAVVAAVEANWAGRLEMTERIFEYARSRGTDRFWNGSWMGGVSLGYLDLVTKPAGWVQGPRKRGYRPGKKSPDLAEFDALRWSPERVPGIPEMFEAPGRDLGKTLMMWSTPFVHDGAAWIMLSEQPTRGDFGDQWVEVKASEAHAAKEAWAEAAKAAQS